MAIDRLSAAPRLPSTADVVTKSPSAPAERAAEAQREPALPPKALAPAPCPTSTPSDGPSFKPHALRASRPHWDRLEGLSIDELARRIATAEHPDATLELALERLPFSETDNLVEALWSAKNGDASWFAARSVQARGKMLQAVREGFVDATDKAIHEALWPSYAADALAASREALADPHNVAALRRRLLAPKSATRRETVSFADVRLRRMAPPVASHHQWLTDAFYRHAVERHSSAEEVRAASTEALVTDPTTGAPLRLDGLTLYRPGLGNVPPSAANLVRWARYAAQAGHGKLVLMYGNHSGDDASKLRRLRSYEGVAIPDGLEVYAIGSEDRVLQSAAADADTFVTQLDEIRREGDAFGIHLNLDGEGEGARVIAHSQGNHAVARARLALAAAGYPRLIADHIALSSAAGGSPVADDNVVGWLASGIGALTTFLSGDGFEAGHDAVAYLDPDSAHGALPWFMWQSFDLNVIGLVDADEAPSYRSLSMSGIDWLLDKIGARTETTDGMVAAASGGVEGAEPPVRTTKAYDHLAMISAWEAADDIAPRITTREQELGVGRSPELLASVAPKATDRQLA